MQGGEYILKILTSCFVHSEKKPFHFFPTSCYQLSATFGSGCLIELLLVCCRHKWSVSVSLLLIFSPLHALQVIVNKRKSHESWLYVVGEGVGYGKVFFHILLALCSTMIQKVIKIPGLTFSQ